jgi:hypothetical protein
MVYQLFKKFSAFCGTRNFVITWIRACLPSDKGVCVCERETVYGIHDWQLYNNLKIRVEEWEIFHPQQWAEDRRKRNFPESLTSSGVIWFTVVHFWHLSFSPVVSQYMNSVYSTFIVLPYCKYQTWTLISAYVRYYFHVPHHGASVHYETPRDQTSRQHTRNIRNPTLVS